MTISGTYHIRPNISISSFPVECDFSTNKGITKVFPLDWPSEGFVFPPNKENRCLEPNCYNKSISYHPNKFQLQSLQSLSDSCNQSIEHHCNINMLTGFSSWVDSLGTVHEFWHGGAISDDHNCRCSHDDTCFTIQDKTLCNCDSMGMNQTDTGTLRLDSLPVYGLRYGGARTLYSSIGFQLGPLTCYGKRGHYPSENENLELENIKSSLTKLKNELNSTKLQQVEIINSIETISDNLEDHLKTTTTTTTTTTTIRPHTGFITNVCNLLIFISELSKTGVFSLKRKYGIGTIEKYYKNYEFSFELRSSRAPSGQFSIVGLFL